MNKPIGTVYIIGAGPGDPGLITLRGVECLRRADVVLYDYLVNPLILRHARPDAERICLGRHGGGRILSQDEINQRLLDHARRGETVVRLKGGDPAVFARAAEEIEALSAAGVPFEIVPGITAALAAGSYAGVPITHRSLSSAVTLVTGHQQSDKDGLDLDYARLAELPGTIVVYMGVTTAPLWSRALLDAGKPPDTPVAIVRRCSLTDQTVTHCTLAEIPDVLAPGQMRPPVIVIIGPVATLDATFDWFTKRPLFGSTVLVTRPVEQAAGMIDRLVELGAGVLVQPAIEIRPPDDWRPVDEAIGRFGEYDWLVFSSANGVRYFLDRLLALGHDMRHMTGVKLAAIGPATCACLAEYHLCADLRPEEYRAEALAAALADQAAGKRFLLARASRSREVLAEQLTSAGASVDQIVVYESRDAQAPDAEVAEAMREGKITWTTVTSSAIARSLVKLFGDDLRRTKLATISPLTSSVLRELGHEVAAEATEYTTEGVIRSVIESDQ